MSLQEMALSVAVPASTLYTWQTKRPEYLELLKLALSDDTFNTAKMNVSPITDKTIIALAEQLAIENH